MFNNVEILFSRISQFTSSIHLLLRKRELFMLFLVNSFTKIRLKKVVVDTLYQLIRNITNQQEKPQQQSQRIIGLQEGQEIQAVIEIVQFLLLTQ